MNLREILRRRVLTIAFHERDVRWTAGAHGRIDTIGSAPLPEHLVRDAVITDPVSAGAILRAVPGPPAGRMMRVIVAVPAQRSLFRQIDVPAVKGAQLDEVIEREIRREMPMLADNARVSWAIGAEHEGKTRVFVAGAPRDVLDSHVAAVRAAGLAPDAVDLRVIAASRAIGASDAVVANVEDGEIEIAIIRDGIPLVIRHVAMAPQDDEAWKDQMAAELARTLKFYCDSHRDDDIVPSLPISFVGGAARRAILAEQVTLSTGHEVAMPPLRVSVDPEDQSVRFAANIGLALKEVAA
ncbi:MAG: pilus assembly protein PilM [Dehalococcoidia bacterium]